jgi:hypothetical protein
MPAHAPATVTSAKHVNHTRDFTLDIMTDFLPARETRGGPERLLGDFAVVGQAPSLDSVGINRREVVNERVIQEKE